MVKLASGPSADDAAAAACIGQWNTAKSMGHHQHLILLDGHLTRLVSEYFFIMAISLGRSTNSLNLQHMEVLTSSSTTIKLSSSGIRRLPLGHHSTLPHHHRPRPLHLRPGIHTCPDLTRTLAAVNIRPILHHTPTSLICPRESHHTQRRSADTPRHAPAGRQAARPAVPPRLPFTRARLRRLALHHPLRARQHGPHPAARAS